jgi:hypothetical protein
MTVSRQKDGRSKPEGVRTAPAFYVYCIAETVVARQIFADSLPSSIEDEAGLELIAVDDLAGVTSRVPLAIYGEESLAQHLTDPAWTAVRAMRHEQVVEHFARRASVIPLRFGTIYLERTGIERMLAERRLALGGIIERLQEREEWGVNLYCDRAKLMTSITSLSSRLRDMAADAAKASPGQAYLMQKKIEALRTDEARAEINRVVNEVETTLQQQSDGSKRLRVLKVEATEYGELKAKFAFLIKRTRFAEFRATAEHLAREHEAAGLRLELTGPWPAYNFAADND